MNAANALNTMSAVMRMPLRTVPASPTLPVVQVNTAPMRVMMVHNAYQQAGGEDGVVDAELALLRSHGHEVHELRRHNDELASMSPIAAAGQAVWSVASKAQARELIELTEPDVVHVHNTFSLISPSVYWACAQAGVPVVQTLHNFRLACPQAMLLREGKPCELCIGRMPWPALVHGCNPGSRARTAVMVGMIGVHRALGTWQHKVTRYIALNEFCRNKFIEAGLPAHKIVVKPNFVAAGPVASGPRSGVLFVGRLAPEKGIEVLGEAWSNVAHRAPALTLRVAGVGAQDWRLANQHGVTLLGALGKAAVRAEMQRAQVLVLPSIWYENMPLTLIEAYACGLPVIASRIGALAELVEHGETGLLFEPGDARGLADALQWATGHPEAMLVMGANARARYEARYSPDINYAQTLAVYRSAIDEVKASA